MIDDVQTSYVVIFQTTLTIFELNFYILSIFQVLFSKTCSFKLEILTQALKDIFLNYFLLKLLKLTNDFFDIIRMG